MPRGIFALSSHNLFSQYRGPTILNEEGAPPPAAPPTPPEPPAPPKKEPDDTEGRITKLVEERNEARKKLKEREDADKAAEEEKLKKKGEHEKLLAQREEELGKLKGEHDTASKTLKAYEEAATEHVTKALEGIKDKDKLASVQKLLEGRSPVEQFKLLPEVLALAGAGSNAFGGGTPPGTPPTTNTKEGLSARLNELNLAAQEKLNKGESLTYAEEKEMRETEKKLRELQFPT